MVKCGVQGDRLSRISEADTDDKSVVEQQTEDNSSIESTDQSTRHNSLIPALQKVMMCYLPQAASFFLSCLNGWWHRVWCGDQTILKVSKR